MGQIKWKCKPYGESFGHLWLKEQGNGFDGGYWISDAEAGDLSHITVTKPGMVNAVWKGRQTGSSGEVTFEVRGNEITWGRWTRYSGSGGGLFTAAHAEGAPPAEIHALPAVSYLTSPNRSAAGRYFGALADVYTSKAGLAGIAADNLAAAKWTWNVAQSGLLWARLTADEWGTLFDRLYWHVDPEVRKAFGEGVVNSIPMKIFYWGQEKAYDLARFATLKVGPYVPPGYAFTGSVMIDLLDLPTALSSNLASTTVTVGLSLVRFSMTHVQPYYVFGFGIGFGRNSSAGATMNYCGSRKLGDQAGWQDIQLTLSGAFGPVGSVVNIPNIADRTTAFLEYLQALEKWDKSPVTIAKDAAEMFFDPKIARGGYVPLFPGDIVNQFKKPSVSFGALFERYYNQPMPSLPVPLWDKIEMLADGLDQAIKTGRAAIQLADRYARMVAAYGRECKRAWTEIINGFGQGFRDLRSLVESHTPGW